jgi:ATP-dependent Clp protease adaptor protein ClpS
LQGAACKHIRVQSSVVAPERLEDTGTGEEEEVDRPWLVIAWNDPINLMSYVTWVFQKLFGYPRPKAEKLMLEVHHKGRAVVASGPREKAELDCFRLHAHGLWATISRS